ncbi:LysR family transcriptional regulator [Streptomyces niveiscabiei]|uniref:LysR family transcriptional regulator n=1 Tax=Streptomyces niveiscabiei TaxID=164115 RepID=UPI0006EB6958|nr:LysR family transcriptional regulator [Streptomyces niveiscabiei]
MDVQKLETFVVVAESGSLAEAADRLGYARSTVTAHLQALERSLGTPLLERGNAGNRLTKAGARFLDYASDILDKLAKAQAAVTAAAQDSRAALHIGATASLCTYRLPGLLRTLHRLMPDLDMQVFVGSVAELRDQVERGDLSAALINSTTAPPPAREENRRHLWTDRPVLVGTPEAVARPRRLLVTAPGCVYRDLAERQALPRLGDVRLQQVGSVDGVKSSALGGLGVGLVPAIAVGSQLESGQLVEIPLPALPPVLTEIVWNTEVTPDHVTRHLQRLRPPQPLPGTGTPVRVPEAPTGAPAHRRVSRTAASRKLPARHP